MCSLSELAEKEGLEFIGCPYAVLEHDTEVAWMLQVYLKPNDNYFHFVIFENGEPAKAFEGIGEHESFMKKLKLVAPEEPTK